MVRLNSGGNYLKTSESKTGDMITFTTEGEWVENKRYTYDDGNPKWDFVVGVSSKGEDKKMTLNKTNRDILTEKFGDETSDWVGKSAKMNIVDCLVGGKMKKTIVLEPIVSAPVQPTEKSEPEKTEQKEPWDG